MIDLSGDVREYYITGEEMIFILQGLAMLADEEQEFVEKLAEQNSKLAITFFRRVRQIDGFRQRLMTELSDGDIEALEKRIEQGDEDGLSAETGRRDAL